MDLTYCKPSCLRCVIHKTPNARGWIYSLRCVRCQRLGESRSWIPKSEVDESKADTMPLFGKMPSDACPICGTIAKLERHHLAPRNRFGDAEMWPQVDICARCHDRWHRIMG